MAKFIQTMKDWRRMCEAKNACDGGCVDLCVLAHNQVCGDLTQATDKDLENAEAVIMKWAQENPEPVYPTWAEYFIHIYHDVSYSKILGETIPADIAEKLGIAPK